MRSCRLTDPAAGALPADAATAAVVGLAAMPWHPGLHDLFMDSSRPVVRTALLVERVPGSGAYRRRSRMATGARASRRR